MNKKNSNTNQSITRYKIFFDFEKEEKWLEQMSAEGLHLTKAADLAYTLVKGEPEQRIYKIDFRHFQKKQDMEDYIALFEDSGWHCVKPRVSSYNFYFYTQSDGTPGDIFSDQPSKAQHYLRYARFMSYSFIPALLPLLIVFLSGTVKLADLGYLTPGLWEMQGTEFISHFLFETPFVLLRVSFVLPLLAVLLGMLYYNLMFYRLAHKTG